METGIVKRGYGIKNRLDDDTITALCDLLEKGNNLTTALSAVSIPARTGYRWLEQGRDNEEAGIENEYTDFYRQVIHAQAIAEIELIEKLKGANKDWTKYAWLIERRNPEWQLRRPFDFVKDNDIKIVFEIKKRNEND